MPRTDTIAPIATICPTLARASRERTGASVAISSSPQNPWGRHPMGEERRTVRRSAGAPEIGARPRYAARAASASYERVKRPGTRPFSAR